MKATDAFKKATSLRAEAYVYFYEEMKKELPRENAIEICKRVTYRLGEKKAGAYPRLTHNNPKSIAEHFISDRLGKKVFDQSIAETSDNSATIEMKYCPLVAEWKKMDLDSNFIALMCDMARQIDFGTIESLGCHLQFLSCIAENDPSCRLKILKK